jgi:hypothetical protein
VHASKTSRTPSEEQAEVEDMAPEFSTFEDFLERLGAPAGGLTSPSSAPSGALDAFSGALTSHSGGFGGLSPSRTSASAAAFAGQDQGAGRDVLSPQVVGSVPSMPGLPLPAFTTPDVIESMTVETAARAPTIWPLWIIADSVAARATREALLWPAVKAYFLLDRLDAGDKRSAEELLGISKIIVEFVKINEMSLEHSTVESLMMYIAMRLYAFRIGVTHGAAKKAEFVHHYTIPAQIFQPFRAVMEGFGPPIRSPDAAASGGRGGGGRGGGPGRSKADKEKDPSKGPAKGKSRWQKWMDKKKKDKKDAEAAKSGKDKSDKSETPAKNEAAASGAREQG